MPRRPRLPEAWAEPMSDRAFIPLSAEDIRAHLPAGLCGLDIHVFQSTDSTSTLAKALGLDGAGHGTVLLAEEQTGGRGRHGRSFYSPPGSGLYMSILLRPDCGADMQLLTVAAAVAACRAIESSAGVTPEIKWVNDLYLSGKKICGILAEAVFSPDTGKMALAVLGIGINCSTESFPAELGGKAGSLGKPGLSRNALAAEITKNLLDGSLPTGQALIDEYRRRSLMLGKQVEYTLNGREYSAVVLDISRGGGLVVRTSDGDIQTLSSGEVSVRGAV